MNQINENIFHNKKNGKFIEVGAGTEGNCTSFFEKELGWTGILIEPNPKSYEQLKSKRPNSIVLNEVISIYSSVIFHSYLGDSKDMSAIPDTVSEELSIVYYNDEIVLTEEKLIAERITKTLNQVININDVYDFIVIDTNGHQLQVLESWDFSPVIEYIIIDLVNIDLASCEKCEELLNKNHYELMDNLFINNVMFDVWRKQKDKKCTIS